MLDQASDLEATSKQHPLLRGRPRLRLSRRLRSKTSSGRNCRIHQRSDLCMRVRVCACVHVLACVCVCTRECCSCFASRKTFVRDSLRHLPGFPGGPEVGGGDEAANARRGGWAQRPTGAAGGVGTAPGVPHAQEGVGASLGGREVLGGRS